MNSTDALQHPPGPTFSETGPWRWIAEGAAIYRRRMWLSAGYGLLFVLVGYGIAAALAGAGMIAAMPVALGAFALAGPLMAAGLYAIARADEQGREADIGEVLAPQAASPLQMAYLGVMVLVAVLFWMVIAIGLFVIFLGGEVAGWSDFAAFALTTPKGIGMLAVGTLFGGCIAASIFAITAFSIPMLMDRETDFATAIAKSVETVRSQPREMMLWAWIIAISLVIGAATLLVGFVLLFPILGFATWRSYREAFPASS